MKKIEIDAKGEKLGRVASKAASFLIGKNSTNFTRNKISETEVKIINVSKLEISDKKKSGKVYTRYTGYHGGLRKKKMEDLISKKKYAEIVKKAIYGMLPSNKLRSKIMKKLIVIE